jgi:hypothetical protein
MRSMATRQDMSNLRRDRDAEELKGRLRSAELRDDLVAEFAKGALRGFEVWIEGGDQHSLGARLFDLEGCVVAGGSGVGEFDGARIAPGFPGRLFDDLEQLTQLPVA